MPGALNPDYRITDRTLPVATTTTELTTNYTNGVNSSRNSTVVRSDPDFIDPGLRIDRIDRLPGAKLENYSRKLRPRQTYHGCANASRHVYRLSASTHINCLIKFLAESLMSSQYGASNSNSPAKEIIIIGLGRFIFFCGYLRLKRRLRQ